MKDFLFIYISLMFSILISFLGGMYIGTNQGKCPPCIEQAQRQCPAEEVFVNTAYGIMHFEPGEIDAMPEYIKTRQQMDELYDKIEQEILKRRGNAS